MYLLSSVGFIRIFYHFSVFQAVSGKVSPGMRNLGTWSFFTMSSFWRTHQWRHIRISYFTGKREFKDCIFRDILTVGSPYSNYSNIIFSGVLIDIADIVETPEMYILARCPASDQQLMYSSTRLQDIKKMHNNPMKHQGIEIADRMRLFKGKKTIFISEIFRKNKIWWLSK